MFESVSAKLGHAFDFARPFLDWLRDTLDAIPLLAWLCLFLGLLLIAAFAYSLQFWMKREKEKAAKGDPPPKEESPKDEETPPYKLPPIGGRFSRYLCRKGFFKVGRLSIDFLEAMDFLERSLRTRDYKYRQPWILMLGGEKTGKTTLLRTLHAIEAEHRGRRSLQADPYDTECNWFFMRSGVALDVSGGLFLRTASINADEVGWNALKNLLVRYRAAKPIDSLILTISMEDLYGAQALTALQCQERAKFMAQKLAQLQDQMGLRLPVYVVITKADLLPGFQDFCNAIPLSTKQQMFGWSSPYTVDKDFSPRWVTEALEAVTSQIRHVIMDVCYEDHSEQSTDSLFVFPYEFAKIADNLTLYLRQIFQREAYKTPLLLRGIYFCGDSCRSSIEAEEKDFIDESLLQGSQPSKTEKKEETSSQTPPTKEATQPEDQYKRVFFFGDLMNSKVLLEYALSVPQKEKAFASNKVLKRLKVTTATIAGVGGLGLYSARNTFVESREALTPAVNSMYRFLVKAQQIPVLDLSKKSAELEDSFRKLSTLMQKLSSPKLFSVFVPASWFSPLKSKLSEALNLAYQNVIMRALYVNLLLKARELLQASPDDTPGTTSIAQLALPTKSNEFIAMKDFVANLTELSKRVDQFNDLRMVPSPSVLAELMDYAFGMTLSEDFLRHYGRMKHKLSTSVFPAIDLHVYKNLAQQAFEGLFQDFYNMIFMKNHPTSFPAQLQGVINQVCSSNMGMGPEIDALRVLTTDWGIVLQSFGSDAKNADGTPAAPKATWMDKEVFEPGPEYEDLLNDLDASPFFGPEVTQAVVDNCAVGLFHLRQKLNEITLLLSTDTRFSKPTDILAADQLSSEGFVALGQALKALFAEPYMRRPSAHKVIDVVPQGKLLYWDEKLLQGACDLCAKYENFATKEVGAFPVVLQESFRLIAREGLCNTITSIIGQSQNLVAGPALSSNARSQEEMIRSLTSNVRQVYPSLVKLLTLLNYESVSFFYITLRDLLLKTNYWLLEQINELMKVVGPYHLWDPSFSWWDGRTNPAYAAYGVKDAQDLSAYLELQGQHVLNLALNYAQPVIEFLTSDVMTTVNPLNQGHLTKWKRIVSQAEAYQKKQPGSSIAALESFVTSTLKNYSLDNVFEQIKLEDIQEEAGDHFLETMQFIKKGVLGRAEILVRHKNIRNYEDLANFFNQRLKGKFPFSPVSQDVSQGFEADPNDFREFMDKFRDYGGSAEKILDQIYQLGSGASAAVAFLQSLEQIADLFEDFLKNNLTGLPSVNVNAEFNVNRDRAVGTSSVAGWTLKTNYETVVSQADKSRKAQWIFNAPTQVAFRWPNVKGMVELPLNDPRQPDLKVLETTATFEYKGGWSLLRMIRRHRANRGEYVPMAQPNAVVLKFTVPVSETKTALLFNALTFMGSSPNPNIPGRVLPFPDFPTAAPDLSQDLAPYVNDPVLSQGIVKPVKITQK